MSLLSHWRERRKFLARTSGRPLWWLVAVLIVVLYIMRMLLRIEKALP